MSQRTPSVCPSPSDIAAPLGHLLVVSLEQAVAAPFCTVRLADAGARVIKVERPEGDFARRYDDVVHGESAYFVWLNRGKESIVLDIKQPQDYALLQRLIGRADVFVQNLAPGATARYGLDSDTLRQANPRLITCDISGYGESGPYSSMKAYDLLIQCETALVDISGGPGEAGRVGVSIADICCGMNAYAGILQALIERAHTGRGKGLAVSLFDGLAEWMSVPLLHHDYSGKAPERLGINHATIAPYGAYQTRDHKRLVLAVQNDREWQAFCAAVLGRSELVGDPRFLSNTQRCAHRQALDAAINHVLHRLTSEELAERLRLAKIAFGVVNSVADFSRHPQLRRVSVETPSGPVEMPAPPVIERGENRPLRAVPGLGADSERIRHEFA
jgi:itaconate CoA-transferase